MVSGDPGSPSVYGTSLHFFPTPETYSRQNFHGAYKGKFFLPPIRSHDNFSGVPGYAAVFAFDTASLGYDEISFRPEKGSDILDCLRHADRPEAGRRDPGFFLRYFSTFLKINV